MADGPPEDLDPEDGGNPEDGPILSPNELDISDSEHVEQLDEGRFVVSPGAREASQTNESDPQLDGSTASETPSQLPEEPQGSERTEQPGSPQPNRREEPSGKEELTEAVVHQWLRRSFTEREARYAFDVTATFDDSVSQRQMASNDVVTIFESLVLWYAQQIDSNTPVEEVLGILLMESNAPVHFPPRSVRKLVKSAGLGPENTIGELLAAIEEEDGFQL